MRDAAGHLAECAQSLLFQHGLLRALEVFVRLLQRVVQLRLVGGQGHLVAELPQEFALATAERIGRASRDHEHREHGIALHHQRHDDHGMESRTRQPAGNGKVLELMSCSYTS